MKPAAALAALRSLFAQRMAQRPLATRISGLLALSGGLTALLAMLVVVIVGWRSAGQFVEREYTEVARVAAFALQAPLVFQDPRGVEDSIGVVMRRLVAAAERGLVFDDVVHGHSYGLGLAERVAEGLDRLGAQHDVAAAVGLTVGAAGRFRVGDVRHGHLDARALRVERRGAGGDGGG